MLLPQRFFLKFVPPGGRGVGWVPPDLQGPEVGFRNLSLFRGFFLAAKLTSKRGSQIRVSNFFFTPFLQSSTIAIIPIHVLWRTNSPGVGAPAAHVPGHQRDSAAALRAADPGRRPGVAASRGRHRAAAAGPRPLPVPRIHAGNRGDDRVAKFWGGWISAVGPN